MVACGVRRCKGCTHLERLAHHMKEARTIRERMGGDNGKDFGEDTGSCHDTEEEDFELVVNWRNLH